MRPPSRPPRYLPTQEQTARNPRGKVSWQRLKWRVLLPLQSEMRMWVCQVAGHRWVEWDHLSARSWLCARCTGSGPVIEVYP